MADNKILNTKLVLRNADFSAWKNSTLSLLQGEVALGRLSGDLSNYYEVRIGTGSKTWTQLSGSNFIIPAKNVTGLEDQISSVKPNYYEKSVSTDLPTDATVPYGSIGVVSAEIGTGTGKYTRTAFWYNKPEGRWEALDGNYSAENVYFADNLTYTKQIGELSATTAGMGILGAKGKNVKQVFDAILAKEADPSVSHPTWSFSGTETLTGEVGKTYNPTGVTATFSSKGSYTYGPDTGITIPVGNMTVQRTTAGFTNISSNTAVLTAGQTVSIPDWSVAQTYLSTSVSYSYSAEAHHTAALSVAKTNLGNDTTITIAADDWNGESTAKSCMKTYTGYYPCYYGQFAGIGIANPDAITSSDIVNYSGADVTAKSGFTKYVKTAQKPDNQSATSYTAQQWFWVCKKGVIADTTKITTHQASPDAAFGTVKKAGTVMLPTANGYGDTEYDVYYVSNGAAAPNKYNWSIA